VIEFLAKGFANIAVTDLIDIAIVSTLVYIVLIWFKQTRAAFILVGILILGAVYLLARRNELFLTVMIFQGFFAVLLVALVVIFQEELRHFFERIAIWGFTYRRMPSPASPLIEIIMRTVSDLSVKRIGALVVFQGRDPLDRHLKGGFDLDGEVSEALLKSLFDPHSPGHDGAVIIHQNRVRKFACLLPLSQNFAKTRLRGTRHAAALGLCERSDAYCVVVSEETGKFGIAYEGNIKTVDGVGRLGPLLEGFYRDRFPTERRSLWVHLFAKNIWEKAVAVFIAVVLWLTFGQRVEILEIDFSVPIRYEHLQEDLYIKKPRPDEAVVTFSGYKRSFNLFDAKDLQIQIDLKDATAGQKVIPLLEAYIPHPETFEVEDIDPRVVRLTIEELTPFTLNVKADITGALPEGLRVETTRINPARLKVYSAENKNVRDLVLMTESISLDGLTETTQIKTNIVVPPGIRPVEQVFPTIEVDIKIESTVRSKPE